MPLQRAAGKFYPLDDGSAYNPAAFAGEPAQYTLVDAAGTRWAINTARGVTSIAYASGVTLYVSDSGVVGPGNEAILFTNDRAGRLTRVTAPDGRSFDYTYDADGNLVSVRDLSAATSERYGYAGGAAHARRRTGGRRGDRLRHDGHDATRDR